jgi:peptide/nickel transport system ATP-binding protein
VSDPTVPADPGTLLEVAGLNKTFRAPRRLFGAQREPQRAVRDVSFTLVPGETLALVGESGAGKSTTGRLVLRLIEPDSGTVRLAGTDLLALGPAELRAQRRRMQMIFQDPFGSLDPRVPIGDSVAEPLLVNFGTKRNDRIEQAATLLERCGMGRHHLGRYPADLSGGQLQRAAIARALTLNPDLIVADEPVAALDVSVRAQVLNLMKDLQEEYGIAYLFITHDLALVEVIADRVAVMQGGEIVETGTVEKIFGGPEQAYTKDLLSAIPVPDPRRRRYSELVSLRPKLDRTDTSSRRFDPSPSRG